ncbi:MAG TPA: Gfo/Idh/MocA family oxidoreductase [Acidobacteriaceae bacterium]|nr:Gfo/Idh/MocA family oxidoreductase [Acidobacteriaceae bacterium]
MIRYGILGFGHHGRKRLIPAFAGARTSKLDGIWRRDLEMARENAAEFNIAHVFPTAEELCASPDIDAVFVTSPDALHMRDTLLALKHRKPVLCEKPLAMHANEAREMLAAARSAGVAFGVAQNFRYNRSLNLIRHWIEAGRIGKPVFATAQFCFQSERSPRAWIYDKSLAYSGPIGDVGIHCLDALRYILQDDVAAVTTIARSDLDSSEIETSAALALAFASGALGSVSVSFRADYRTLVEVTGEHGAIQSENGLSVDSSINVRLLQDGKVVESQELSNGDAYSRMLDAFSETIEGTGTYAASGEDGLKNQLALDAAYASWRSGRQEIVTY